MPNKVVSKYFLNVAVMDDSLSDFKEKKKYNTGPKKVKKTSNTKKPKRTRGQKDIRTLIKNQENDVLLYSKDFDKVCKESGVDVDSEELQVAIALSKSLQEVKNKCISNLEDKGTETLTPHQRTLKIKTTLQEYGFKADKTKTRPAETHKRKRFKKQSKLLLISETERQQIISDKYSEVLAGNILKSPIEGTESDYSDKELYYKTTNITYERIKNDDLYYVKKLFEKSDHKSSMLREWSEIPGRPLSPIVEVKDFSFGDIECNQHELDCVLSGTIFTAQQIVINKNSESLHCYIKDKATLLKLDEFKPLKNEEHLEDVVVKTEENTNFKESNENFKLKSSTMSQLRCISPDLFDEDESAVIECSDKLPNSGQLSDINNINTYCMDLTECVNIKANNHDFYAKSKMQNSNVYNVTSRKSNDLMEITECVSSSLKQNDVEKVDLTQSSNGLNKQIVNISQKYNEVMDLTQVPDYDSMGSINHGNKKENMTLDDTVILIDEDVNLKLQRKKSTLEELPEPICIDDVNKSETDSTSENDKQQQSLRKNFKDKSYEIFKSNDCNDIDERHLLKNIKEVDECTNEMVENQPEELDLTQSFKSSQEKIETNLLITKYSVKEKLFDIDCDDNERLLYKNIKKVDECMNNTFENQHDELDLTQSSKSSHGDTFIDQLILNYASSLGKKDNLSIDYDEIDNDIHSESINSLNLDKYLEYKSNSTENETNIYNKEIISDSNKISELGFSKNESFRNNDLICETAVNFKNGSPEKDAFNLNNDVASNPSKSSEVFEISDNEFNYSLHQSKHENFNCRDVSVMNDYDNFSIHDNLSALTNRSLSESNLPKESTNIVSPHKEVSQSQKLNYNSETSSLLKRGNFKNVLNTPKNIEYIIKTNEVTPMLDYASMSSPERNKELEKYGIKPFKRKRAIQLLTYLYNQTHPIIGSHDDVGPSPSKRLKIDDGGEKDDSLKKATKSQSLEHVDSIRTTSNAPVKYIEPIPEVNKGNDLYVITNEQPDIRNIECDAEDWFFQKREKAKLHSCRVPLHVAFHNYVSCRRHLREAILCYEPVNIDVIHKDLVATGYRYNPKDLLKFMDRKCITVKTADNSRNRKS